MLQLKKKRSQGPKSLLLILHSSQNSMLFTRRSVYSLTVTITCWRILDAAGHTFPASNWGPGQTHYGQYLHSVMKRIFVGFAAICSGGKERREVRRQEIGKEECGDGRLVAKATNTRRGHWQAAEEENGIDVNRRHETDTVREGECESPPGSLWEFGSLFVATSEV